MVIVLNHLLSTWFRPAADLLSLASPAMAPPRQAVRGVWSVIGALGVVNRPADRPVVACNDAACCLRGPLPLEGAVLEEGNGCVMPLDEHGIQVGFGAVIASWQVLR